MKLLKSALLASAFVGLSSLGGAFALGANATVNILSPIAITENAPLRFGNIVKPSAGTDDFTVYNNSSTSHTGTDGQFAPGAPRGAGSYSTDGVDGASYIVTTASTGSCSDPGLSLTDVVNNATQVLDETFNVGGTLHVASTTGGGPQTCGYTVTALYP